MRKTLRISAIVLVALIAFALVCNLGIKTYLGTGSARRSISAQLTDRFGGDILVKDVSSGLGSTSVEIEVPGKSIDGAAAPTAPLVTGTVRLDASPIALAAGSSPDTVTVENAQITLHFDKEGNLKDKLPQPKAGAGGGKLPTIKVHGASVHFKQDGKPDFRASGIDFTLADGGASLAMTGHGQDPHWGGWTLTGEWASDGSNGSFEFKSTGIIAVTPEKLKSIPFVPLEVWDAVELEGSTPVEVRVGRGADAKWWWKVFTKPTLSKLHIPSIDLGFTDVTGTLVVDGTKITLTDVTGKTADGTVRTSAVIDVAPHSTTLKFDEIAVKGLDITKLPKTWGLPPQYSEGWAVGSANVQVAIAEGKTTVSGGGKIHLEKAKFLGFLDEKATFEMYSDGKRLRFGTPPPKPAEKKVLRQLPRFDPVRFAALFVFLLQQPAKPDPKKPVEVTYVQANLKLRDVDLAEFLERAQIALPVKVKGKLTIEVAAEIPVNDSGKLKSYRVKGTASSPELQIEGLTLKNLTAEVELRNGILTLTKFAADVPDASQPTAKPGSFLGSASYAVDPPGDLSADLQLTNLPLGPIVAAVPGLSDVASGTVSGSFKIASTGGKLTDLAGLQGSGKLTAETLTIYNRKADNVAIEITVEKGIAQVTKATAELFRGSLTATVKYPLVGTAPATINLAFKDLDAVAATKDIPSMPVKVEGRVSGKLDGSIPPAKANEDRTLQGTLLLDAPKLKVQGIPAERLRGTIGYKPGKVTYALKGETLGGNFDIDGTYPLGNAKPPADAPKPAADAPKVGPPKPGSQLRLNNVRLEKLGEALKIPELASLRGNLSGSVNFDFDFDGPIGSGRIDLTGFGWNRDIGSNIVAVVRITPQKIELSEVAGTFAGGTVRGRLSYLLDSTRGSHYSISLLNANAETVLEPFGVRNVDGEFDVNLSGTIGRGITGAGTITSTRMLVNGIRIENLRTNGEWSLGIGGTGQFAVRDAAARIAGGRVRGSGLVRWGEDTHVDGKIDFADVYLRGLLAQLGQSTGTISGRTTGKFTFKGERVHSVDDLQGNLTATLGEAQVAALPVFRALTPYVAPLRGVAPFKQGEVSARLGGGKLHIDRLTLMGSSVTMFIEGDVGLKGRLDLNVIANTGNLAPAPGALQSLGVRLPFVGPLPVALILEVVNYLSNRVVRLTVGGTFDRPSVQVNVLALLSDEGVRFFLNRYFAFKNQSVLVPR